MVKTLRKSYENYEAQFPELSCFYWPKDRYYVVIAFKMLKREFKI